MSASRPAAPRPGRARRLAALGLAAALALAGCSAVGQGPGSGVEGAGYEAGDGSWTTWETGERTGPVDLTGTTYAGEALDVADWRGDVVVVNFWYAACPPCRAEAPDLAAVHADYSGEGVRMLGVNPRDDAATAQAFERTFAVPYPSLHDDDARAVAAMQGLVPLQAMPTTVVLDRSGRVAARVLGQADPTILRGLLDDVLAEAA